MKNKTLKMRSFLVILCHRVSFSDVRGKIIKANITIYIVYTQRYMYVHHMSKRENIDISSY